MKNKLSISIAMCTYNGAKYLKEQLDSIKNQSVLPYELVVCDDVSTDDTMNMLTEFSATVNFKVNIYANEVNLGSTKNFEKAIRLCGGDIIALADQDDVWHQDKLEKIYAVFQQDYKVGLVFSNGNAVDENRNLLGYSLWQSFRFTMREQKLIENSKAFEVLLGHCIVTGAAMAFRANFIGLILPIPVNWVHDSWIALLISTVAKIKPIPQPLIDYRVHAEQQIGAGYKKNFFEKLKLINNSEDCLIYLQQSQCLRQKLLTYPNTLLTQHQLRIVDDRISHLNVRIKIPQLQYYKRFPLIIKELMMYRYHRYSNGVSSFAKDIFKETKCG